MRRLPVLAALTALPLIGCPAPSKKADGAAVGLTPTKPTVALVMKSLTDELYQAMEKGAKAHQAAHPEQYALLANGIQDESHVARQQQLIEQMIAQRVGAIVLAPADPKAVVPACKKALDAKIPVIVIESKLDEAALAEQGVQIPFVGPDNRKGARLAAEFLARKLQRGDAVAILEGVPTAFNARQRKAGFEDALKAAQIDIVASQSAGRETDKARKVAAALIGAHPNLKAILCTSDSIALGAAAAVKAAGKQGKVAVVGFGNSKAVRTLIKDGAILCTVDQHADTLAIFGIEYALDAIAGKAPAGDKETPMGLVTSETLAR